MMLARTLLATFGVGCALGAGAMALFGRRSSTTEPPVLASVPPAREIGPVESGEFPDDLSLQEVYDRVSFLS
jgi:hypothetical protein